MLFNSLEFILAFLPITIVGTLLLGRAGLVPLATLWLVACSLFFYAWWRPVYLPLILLSIVCNYVLVLKIHKDRGAPSSVRALVAAITFNLGLLAYFKYTDFAIASLNDVFKTEIPTAEILLPLAISFFTFQQIAYVVDCYRGETNEPHFLKYCLFVSFFPQLIAGPIVHHREMMPQFDQLRYKLHVEDLSVGLTFFILGLAKKVLIADNLAPHANAVFSAAARGSDPTLLEAWGGALAYTFQLYFDFSGYSDMAVGLGRILGVKLPLNFYSPYKAVNIAEFWRRWHITLSRFLRDYLYISLGGSRRGTTRRYTNLMITMLLGGLWHGAGWTFVLWGALHGSYLVIHRVIQHAANQSGLIAAVVRIRVLAWGATFVAVVVGWVLFRAGSVDTAGAVLLGMIGRNGVSLPVQLRFVVGPLEAVGVTFNDMGAFQEIAVLWVLFAGLLAFFAPNVPQLLSGRGSDLTNSLGGKVGQLAPRFAVPVVLGMLLFFCLRAQFVLAPSEFLYFNF